VRPTFGDARLITAVMALRHLDSRLQPLEARYGLSNPGGEGQSSDIDARFAEAERKRVEMAKEEHISKIEKMAELREHTKENDTLGLNEPAEPQDQPQPKDDRNKFLRFDPSSGNQAQKTPQHPVGDAFVPMPTRDQYNLMRHEFEARENRAFRDRERALIQDMKDKIEADNKLRWN
jgi:hypothetical protein